jgi:hypothetical protein
MRKAVGEMRRVVRPRGVVSACVWDYDSGMQMLRVFEETAVAIDQEFASFDDYWGPFLKGAGPGGAHVASLAQDARGRLEARLRNRLLGNRDDGPIALKARAWCVRGEVRGAQ